MHRKVCFTLFFLLIFPLLTHAQSDDSIELSFDSPVGNVTWSPTGSKLAFTTGLTVHIYDQIGQNLHTIQLNDQDAPIRISQLIWSRSENYIAVLSRPDQYAGLTVFVDVHVYSIEDGSLFLDLGETLEENQYIFGSITHVDFSSDDRMMSIVSSQYIGGHAYESNVYLVNLDTREIQQLARFGGMGSSAIRTAWSPSGDILAVDFVSYIELWDTTTMEEVTLISTGRTSTSALHWEDELTLMTIGANVQRWNTQTGELLSSFPLFNAEFSEARTAIDYDSSMNRIQFYYYGAESRVEAFDGQTGRMTHLLLVEDLGHADEFGYYVFNAGGTAYAGVNREDIIIAAVEMPAVIIAASDFTMQYLETEPIPDEPLLNAHWNFDSTLVVQSEHGVMNLSDAQPQWRMFRPAGDVQLIENAYSTSGRLQAASLYNADSGIMNIQLWDLLEQAQVFEFEGYLDLRDAVPLTRHNLHFDIPLPASTESDLRNPDKAQLRADILAMRVARMSYRQIAREVGIHFTRVQQIVKSTK